MSQIKTALLLSVICAAFSLNGCGDNNSKVVFHAESGKHPANWSVGHKTSAKANLEGCIECHGENLDGGIANVSCSRCHIGSSESIHPDQWGQYAYARHKNYVALNGTARCANASCHGALLTGVLGSGSSCATACHMGGIASRHPAVWTQFSSHGNFARSNGIGGCSIAACHGTDSRGVFLSGPSCYQCHPYAANAKHPPTLIDGNGHFVHNSYVNTNGSATCTTSNCHGAGGTGPSCSTSGCH